jgi:hypothetical protein
MPNLLRQSISCLLLGTAVAALPAVAERTHELPLVERQTRQFELAFPDPGRPLAVDVDNWWGPVTVIGTDTAVVSVALQETVRAANREELARARREVHLDTTPDPGRNQVRLYVDGPFRCGQGGNRWRGGDDREEDRGEAERPPCRRRIDEDYQVHYALTVRVPRTADVIASTINGGDLEARGLAGRYRLANVNGNLTLTDLPGPGDREAGPCSAVTVNGTLRAHFLRNPQTALRLSTVNGNVDLAFPASLAADFSFSTMHGEINSDFPYQTLPRTAATGERHGTRYVYRSAQPAVRIGSGGPRIEVSTLNGNILLRRH